MYIRLFELLKETVLRPIKLLMIPAVKKKRRGELDFWRREIQVYTQWLKGELNNLYGINRPEQHEAVPAESIATSSILTWIRKDGDKYLRHLNVKADIFRGKRVLEIGCGPLPYSLCFTDCEIIGLDPLLKDYVEAGYPLTFYSKRFQYVCGVGEKIPLANASVHAILSVNSIDHVDELWRVAKEIDRVLIPRGLILIEAHYHDQRPLEPWALNNLVMKEVFKARSLVKIMERSFADFYPMYPERHHEKLTIWTNYPELVLR